MNKKLLMCCIIFSQTTLHGMKKYRLPYKSEFALRTYHIQKTNTLNNLNVKLYQLYGALKRLDKKFRVYRIFRHDRSEYFHSFISGIAETAANHSNHVDELVLILRESEQILDFYHKKMIPYQASYFGKPSPNLDKKFHECNGAVQSLNKELEQVLLQCKQSNSNKIEGLVRIGGGLNDETNKNIGDKLQKRIKYSDTINKSLSFCIQQQTTLDKN